MPKTEECFEVFQLGLEKDYEELESGDGYVVSRTECPTAAIHPKADTRFIALLEFLHDVPRGNHYHRKKIEHLVVLRGRLKCELAPADGSSAAEEVILSAGQQVRIQPGCVHTYTALNGNVLALEYSPQKYEAADVVMVG